MGCDIHMHVERRADEFEPWELADDVECYYGRNYQLFAALAGVRNENGITPIHEPRGLPDDASHAVLSERADWGSDGHSDSWATQRELTFWEGWGQSYEQTWLLSPESFPRARMSDERFLEIQRHADEHGVLPWDGTFSACKRAWPEDLHRRIVYREQLSKVLGDRWAGFMAQLAVVGQVVGIDNVRVIYWFDN